MTKILITGATGFIGRSLFQNLKLKKKYLLHLSTRANQEKLFEGAKVFKIIEINSKTNWTATLDGVDCVVHCAAMMRISKERQNDSSNAYLRVNVEGTRNLAEQAARLGVKRFIFLSSIKVNGEGTIGSARYKYNDVLQPQDGYGISKWEAEKTLLEISKQTGLEIVIIRAPLVYGNGVKGNFLHLLNLVFKQVPLPFAKINNFRSFIAVDNLIDLIICCIDHPKAGGKTFLVSDGDDVSTPDLIRKLSKLMGKSPRLFAVPQLIIRLIGCLVGKSLEVERLLGSLRVDNSYTRETLGWSPVLSLDEGLKKTVRWYLRSQ
jgi:nucleoside-diphosphate-sugar epimerase